jgi:hypothetical protein
MDAVADRLADALDDSLHSLARLRRSQPLTDQEAVTALAALLHTRGIQLNDSLLQTLTEQPERLDQRHGGDTHASTRLDGCEPGTVTPDR